MECLRLALLVIFLICAVPRQSQGFFREFLEKPAQGDNSSSPTTHQISPSPSPAPATNLNYGNAQSPLSQPTCDKVSNRCDIKDCNVTTCILLVGNGSQASYVLVLNGESSVKLNIVVRPANITLENTVITERVKKVNLPSNMGGVSSILVNVENEECVIPMGALIPQGFFTSYLTPTNGSYILFVAALFIGGCWACCKVVKRRRHLDGVPYRELEMEQKNSNSTFAIETHEGWDEKWDDEWDEEKAVRSPGTNHIGNVSDNGASLKYIDTDQWRNGWDD